MFTYRKFTRMAAQTKPLARGTSQLKAHHLFLAFYACFTNSRKRSKGVVGFGAVKPHIQIRVAMFHCFFKHPPGAFKYLSAYMPAELYLFLEIRNALQCSLHKAGRTGSYNTS